MQTLWWLGGMVALALATAAEAAGTIPVKVTATAGDCIESPVSVVVPEAALKGKRAPRGAVRAACQVEPAGKGAVRLTFLVRDLKRGESRTYLLSPTPAGREGVTVRAGGTGAEILIDGELFTRYDTTTGPNKPYFWPIVGPTGKPVTRHYPLEKFAGETEDHPHHRGLWFTHGEMNGVDFWSESPTAGKTVHRVFETLESGPVYGRLRARTDWIAPDGKKLAEDIREARVYRVADGRLMDFAIMVTAVGGPLVWGDTKEGTFALRIADSMRADAGKGKVAEGKMVNAEGLTQESAWGKASPWVDYVGPVDGQTVGVTIFDTPSNPRYPTTWHARTYGLFAVNPFGWHDFDPAKKDDRHAGDLTTPEGQSVTFHYRLFFHKGTTEEARIAERWQSIAHPPTVEAL